MLQSSPRSYERANIAALVRKYQNDVKQELQSPSKLKEKHSDDSGKLVKEHKIQVCLYYLEFAKSFTILFWVWKRSTAQYVMWNNNTNYLN